MAHSFDTVADLLNHGFDTVVDVRSPTEFAIDHVPGAINLPALSDQERHDVGTIYTQISAFDARKTGAALLARNVADHVEHRLNDRDGSWRPLVYCWRGGQRSGAFSIILQQIGWRADTLDGGYMQWRRLVKSTLYDTPLPHRLILLDGNTGTAKTAILAKLAQLGVQTIDLEGLAGHRGSLLGATTVGQPSQKWFESQLAAAMSQLDPTQPVIVEAESSKVGQINLPKQVWQTMLDAPRIMISAPLSERAGFLQAAYADIVQDPPELARRLDRLRNLRGHDVIEKWLLMLKQGDMRALAAALMTDHYDPAYAKSRKNRSYNVIDQIDAGSLDDAGQLAVAEQIAAAVS